MSRGRERPTPPARTDTALPDRCDAPADVPRAHGRAGARCSTSELGVRLRSVGRLDFDAEGLLLLTNDGDLAYRLTHPRHGVRRVYHVLVEGRLEPAVLEALQRGVVLEDGPARVERARRLRDGEGGRHWIELSLAEGRYREVKRLCRAVGLAVRRLRRVAFGPLQLGTLAPGQWRDLTTAELRHPGHPGSAGRTGRDA